MITLLLSIGIVTIFWLMYFLYFKRRATIFFNRYYLLSAWVASFIIPLLGYFFAPTYIQELKLNEDAISMLLQNKTVNATAVEHSEISFVTVLLYVYFAVVFVLSLRLLYSITKVYSVIKQSKLCQYKGFYYYHTEQKIAPFSFFNAIVLNHDYISETDLKCVLTHEDIHIHDKHHYDLLLSELACIVLWFFPVSYWLKKQVKENLEYITDYKSVQIHDKKHYQNTLIRMVAPQYQLEMATHFNKQMLKNRILMMNKPNNRKNRWNILFLPLMLVLFTAISVKAQEKTETKIVVITNDKDLDKEQVKVEITKNGKTETVSSDAIDFIHNNYEKSSVQINSGNKKMVFTSKDTIIFSNIYDNIETNIIKGKYLNTEEDVKKLMKRISKNVALSNKELEKIEKELKEALQEEKVVKLDEVNKQLNKYYFLTDGEEGTYSYELKNKDGNIIIKTDNFDLKKEPKIILNGKEISKQEMDKLNSENVKSISIYKGNAIPKEYIEKSKDGVIIIETK